MAEGALQALATGANIVIDPFGTSPTLLAEAAQAGRSVIAAVNNPVTRFVVRHTLQPIGLPALRNALSSLANAPQDDGRLEPFLMDLYRTACSNCGEYAHAESFIWDREQERPVERVYVCPHCGQSAHEPATEEDVELALMHEGRGLHIARAMEQVAPAGDPVRANVQEALNVYPGRALYAIVTLTNKMQRLSLDDTVERAAHALLLSAFDALNALWGVPEGRSRPLQLIADPSFRELNAWKALEAGVKQWDLNGSATEILEASPERVPERGSVAIFSGSARDLLASQPAKSIEVALFSFPRPNQAFWTLSALWTAWLWGREAAAPIKAALRRRRYDWAWHASALRTSLIDLPRVLKEPETVIGFIPDAEPGFVAAATLGMERAGFVLAGAALRTQPAHAIHLWNAGAGQGGGAELEATIRAAAEGVIQRRGEPQSYARIHHAVWVALAESGALKQLASAEHPMQVINELLEKVLLENANLMHLAKGIEAEAGQYWLAQPAEAASPLSDRVEQFVLAQLRSGSDRSSLEYDRLLCQEMPSELTPDRRILDACLVSYATEDEGSGLWQLRQEDYPEARERDRQETERQLAEMGRRLGFKVPEGSPLRWLDDEDRPAYLFKINEMAAMRHALADVSDAGGAKEILVVPGGRASLVAAKSAQNRWLRNWLESGVRIVKFRHVRRLYAETTLSRDNLQERLSIDPPGRHDPQMPLL